MTNRYAWAVTTRVKVDHEQYYYLDWDVMHPYMDDLPLYGAGSSEGRRSSRQPGEDIEDAPHVTKLDSKDVLVVEDETHLRELIADVLEAEGHVARTAANGLEALTAIRDRKPQIILLDLMMPIMDGWEFMHTLRANHEWDGIPVVVITAVYDVKRTQQRTGAMAVITKPFDIGEIADVVRTYAI